MYDATVPLPTAVGPASTTRRSPVPPCAATQSATNSRSRRRWRRPRPPRRLDVEIARSSMMRPDFVCPIAGMDVRNSLTLRRPSTPSGDSNASRSTSSGLRAALAMSDFTAARARRAATAARDAATRSTSGGAEVLACSDTHGSDLVGATGDGVGDAIGSGTQDGAGLAHDHAGGEGAEHDPQVGDLAALVPEARREHRKSGSRRLRVDVDARECEVGGRAEHDAGGAESPARGIRSPLVPGDDARRDRARDGGAGAARLLEHGTLDRARLGIRRRGEHEDALARLFGGDEDLLDR